MSAEKRPFLWLEAAAQIRQRLPNAQFLLFGDGPMRDVVQARAAALGFGDSFHYTGVNNDLRTAFAPADLVMLASQQEGTPNVLIEAQAMGLPVVTTPAFGAAEAVHDGATGRVVRDESAHGIAVAAVALLQDAAFRERAHAEGPLWAETRFGMKRMIDDTLASHAAIGARR